ncbi:hypothetical protein ABPG73_011067 [Tetrahymena malaccensis]
MKEQFLAFQKRLRIILVLIIYLKIAFAQTVSVSIVTPFKSQYTNLNIQTTYKVLTQLTLSFVLQTNNPSFIISDTQPTVNDQNYQLACDQIAQSCTLTPSAQQYIPTYASLYIGLFQNPALNSVGINLVEYYQDQSHSSFSYTISLNTRSQNTPTQFVNNQIKNAQSPLIVTFQYAYLDNSYLQFNIANSQCFTNAFSATLKTELDQIQNINFTCQYVQVVVYCSCSSENLNFKKTDKLQTSTLNFNSWTNPQSNQLQSTFSFLQQGAQIINVQQNALSISFIYDQFQLFDITPNQNQILSIQSSIQVTIKFLPAQFCLQTQQQTLTFIHPYQLIANSFTLTINQQANSNNVTNTSIAQNQQGNFTIQFPCPSGQSFQFYQLILNAQNPMQSIYPSPQSYQFSLTMQTYSGLSQSVTQNITQIKYYETSKPQNFSLSFQNSQPQFSDISNLQLNYQSTMLISTNYAIIIIIPIQNSFIKNTSSSVTNQNCQVSSYNSTYFQVQLNQQIPSCSNRYCQTTLSQTLNCLQNLDYINSSLTYNNNIQVLVTNSTQDGIFENIHLSLALSSLVPYYAQYPILSQVGSQSSTISNVQSNLPLQIQLELTPYLIQNGAQIIIKIPQFALYYQQSNNNCVGQTFTYSLYQSQNDNYLEPSIQILTVNLSSPSNQSSPIQFTLCNLQSSFIQQNFMMQQFTYQAFPLSADISKITNLVATKTSTTNTNLSQLSAQAYNLVNSVSYNIATQLTGAIGNQTISFTTSVDLIAQSSYLTISIPNSIQMPQSSTVCFINGVTCTIKNISSQSQSFQIQITQKITQGTQVNIVFVGIQNQRTQTQYIQQQITINQQYFYQSQYQNQAIYQSSQFSVQINPSPFKSSSLTISTDTQNSLRTIHINFVVTNVIQSTDYIIFDFTGSSIQVSSNTKIYYINQNNQQINVNLSLSNQILQFQSPQTSDGSTNTSFSFIIVNTVDITSAQTSSRIKASIQDSSSVLIQQDTIIIKGGMIVERESSSTAAAGAISSYSFYFSLTQNIICAQTTLQITLPSQCKYSPRVPTSAIQCKIRNSDNILQCSSIQQGQNQNISIQPCIQNQNQLSAGSVLAISINLINGYFIGQCDQSYNIVASFQQSSNFLPNFIYNASLLPSSSVGTFDTAIQSNSQVVNAKSVILTLTLNMNSILVDNTSNGGQIQITPSSQSPIPFSYLGQTCTATCLQPSTFNKQFENCSLQTTNYLVSFQGDSTNYCQTVQVIINLQYNPISTKQATAFTISVLSSLNTGSSKVQETSQVIYGAQTVGSLSNLNLTPTSTIAKKPISLNLSFKSSIQNNQFQSQVIVVYICLSNQISTKLISNQQCQVTTLDNQQYVTVSSTYGSPSISIQNCFMNWPYQTVPNSQANINNQFSIRTFLQESGGNIYEIDRGTVNGYNVLPQTFDQIAVNTNSDTVGQNPQLNMKLKLSNFSIDSYLIQISFPDYRYMLSNTSVQPQYRLSASANFQLVNSATYYSQSTQQIQRLQQITVQLSTNDLQGTCVDQNCQQNQLYLEISQIFNINAIINQQSQNQQNIQLTILQNTQTYQQIYYQSSQSINQLILNQINQFQVNVQPALINQSIQFYYQLFLNPLIFSSNRRQLRFILPSNQLVGNSISCYQVLNSGSTDRIPCSINSFKQLQMQPTEFQRNITLIYNSTAQTASKFNDLSVFVDETIDQDFYPSFQSSLQSFVLYTSNSTCNQPSCQSCYDTSICNQCQPPNLLYQGKCVASCPSGTIYNQSQCIPCGGNCVVCQNQSFCSQCDKDYVMSDGICVLNCPINTTKVQLQSGQYVCQGLQCNVPNCKSCSNSSKICTQCNPGYHLIYQTDGAVVCVQDSNTNCPETNMYYDSVNKICKYCNPECQTCSGGTNLDCITCSNTYGNLYLDKVNNKCVSSCPDGTYANEQSKICNPCDKSCKTCINSTSCVICDPKYPYFLNSLCVSQCPAQMFVQINTCTKCHQSCQTCSDTTSCLTCDKLTPYLYNKQCIDKCPQSTYLDSQNVCRNCDKSCQSCSDSNSCDICSTKYPYENGKLCVQNCPEKTYQNESKCSPCHISCKTCTDATSCSSCDPQYPYLMKESLCVEKCEDTKYETKENECVLKVKEKNTYNKTLALTIISLILIVITTIAIFSLFSIHKSKVALIITLSSAFAMLENLTKIFMIIMSLDSVICILVLLSYTVNAIYGVSARNLFDKFEELGYEQWKQFSQQVKTKKYPKIYKLWYYLYFLGPQSIRISQSLFYQQDIDFYQKQSFKDQATQLIGQCYLFNLFQVLIDIISIVIYSTSFDPFGLGIINICIYFISLLSFIREDPEIVKDFFRYLIRKYRILTMKMKG